MNKKCPVPMKIGTGQGQRTKRPRNQLKLLADNSEPRGTAPAALEPEEAQAASAAIAAKKGDVAVVVPVLPDRTEKNDGTLPLLIGMDSRKSEPFMEGGGTVALSVHLFERLF